MAGILYGVGVGPGEPELMTLKAVNTIRQCPVIAVPQTKSGGTLALDIAAQVVALAGKTIVELPFLMTRDPEKLQENHKANTDVIAGYLQQDQDVAMLNLGDVSIFSTYSYIAQQIEERGFQTRMVAGVPSFCAAAAVVNRSLTQKELPVHIIPAGYEGWEESLDLPGSKILMKPGRSLPDVCQVLARRGLGEKASLVQNCGLPLQRVFPNLAALSKEETDALDGAGAGYFSLIIIN